MVAPEEVDTFARAMSSRLHKGEVPLRNTYLRPMIDSVEVAHEEVRITSRRDILEKSAVNGANEAPGDRRPVDDWRTRHDSNV